VTREAQFQRKKELIRKRLLKYTRKAFHTLPKLDRPRILDLGCGSGVPTMELARLSNGEITALDIDQTALDILNGKIERAGLTDRIKTMNRSILDMDFPEESFDIVWAEGSIHDIGFERGIRECRRFLKPNGYLMVHDEEGNVAEKIEQISRGGYELIDHFVLDKDAWWKEYFAPLERLIGETRTKYGHDQMIIKELQSSQRDIDTFYSNPELCTSVCFIMRKK
jgi:ubiquinone/menaquinone biosynthesis C-methylase UbiE